MHSDVPVTENNEPCDRLPDNAEECVLNEPFLDDEIEKALKRLKNNKAAGFDCIINEFLKNSPQTMVHMLTRWFNLVLRSGVIPEEWCIGIIQPIFKKKGSPNDPDNYRGITLLSCVGKLFTAVINARLNTFLESNSILGMEQAGFRHGFSTIDHIFALHCIAAYYTAKRKRLYVAFLDYKKAFDLIDRQALWSKLLQSGIRGQVLDVIRNLYNRAKSCIRARDGMSEFFVSKIGVRQGENLSPLLFALYLNDFKEFMDNRVDGLDDISSAISLAGSDTARELDTLVRMSVLLYADDTILMAETENGLQLALKAVEEYCRTWTITVNPAKTKVLIFSRGKVRKFPQWTLEGVRLEVASEFCYLGVHFNYNNNMKKAIHHQVKQAERALYALRSKIRRLNLPLDIAIHLFNHTITPILLYGSEVWAFEDTEQLDVFQRKFLKEEMGLRRSTPNCMVYGEVGQSKISQLANQRMLSYWYKIAGSGGEKKLPGILLRLMQGISGREGTHFKWLEGVKAKLGRSGFSDCVPLNNPTWFKEAIKLRLSDIDLQEWSGEVSNHQSCTVYRTFKTKPGIVQSIVKLSKPESRLLFRFRCGNFPLPIYPHLHSTSLTVPNACQICGATRGDEFHYLLECPEFKISRERFIARKIWLRPNVIKFCDLMNSNSQSTMKKLVMFLEIVLSKLSRND